MCILAVALVFNTSSVDTAIRGSSTVKISTDPPHIVRAN